MVTVLVRHLWSALRSVNLASLRWLFRPGRMTEYLRTVNRAYLRRTASPIRTVQLGELVQASSLSIRVPLADLKVPPSSPSSDILALAAIARFRRPRAVFEIGTFEGASAVAFAWNSPDDAVVHTLDLPPDEQVPRTRRSVKAKSVAEGYRSGSLIDRLECGEKVVRLYGDSALYDFSRFRGSVDLFFIDGCHQLDYVRNDTAVAATCTKENGWIVWHDALNTQVFRVLRMVARRVPVFLVEGTHLAVATEPPDESFAESLRVKMR